ncbi:hypothetical protein AKJ36_02390 [candidate division MSBL1 archaeon SCGC-AAA259I07]|uniref:Uncharacterized protein n=1 Tax=candidate division MSBL1 archaeon SCGC-AAA259I07 TaxID=1698266 RepID=A0A133UKJ5_9EURY|nr:hypothetical protein AKJ36_02390 [candidate division MSBL1 archaeon SCGC-AAA259I07]
MVLQYEQEEIFSETRPRNNVWWNDRISKRWVLQKWAEVREKALDFLSHHGVVPVCPLCEEWEFDRSARRGVARRLSGVKNLAHEFVSHLEKSHNVKVLRVLPKEQAGDITVVTKTGDLVVPSYRENS